MKAIVIHNYGPPDVLKYETVPDDWLIATQARHPRIVSSSGRSKPKCSVTSERTALRSVKCAPRAAPLLIIWTP
jgi:hypothetical protein